MTHAVLADYEAINREDVPTELVEHVATALTAAEDDLLREVGYDFYVAGELAGRDWVRLACWRAKEYLNVTAPENAALYGTPFQSESIGRYSYTLRDPATTMLSNPRYRPIMNYYRGMVSADVQYRTSVVAGDEYSRPL